MTFFEQRYRRYVIDLTKQLIKTAPENPPGKEEQAALVLLDELEKLGLKTTLDYVESKRPNVIATIEGTKNEKTLIFNGHTDVVPAGPDWSKDPFTPYIKDNKLFGRGAVDMLGGLAGMVTAIKKMIDTGQEPENKLIFTAVVGEETGGIGVKKLLKKVTGNYVVIGEPSDLELKIGERGILWLKLFAQGKAAHGSLPYKGINAIEVMFKAIHSLEKIQYDCIYHPYFGANTFNVGKIYGGTKINIVAPCCVSEIDIRIIPGVTVDKLEKEIKKKLTYLSNKFKVKFKYEILQKSDPYIIPESSEIVKATISSMKDILSKAPKISGMCAATDGRFFYRKGILPVIIGPTPLKRAHTADEYVTLQSLYSVTAIYYNLLRELLFKN